MYQFSLCRLAALLLLSPLVFSCADSEAPPVASARVVTSTDDLIGGNRALGELGDYLIENDQIRVIIQGPGFSRGSGVYGGQLLDIDLRRASEVGPDGRGSGKDAFGELFPAFFTQSIAVDEVEILSDGSDGGPARVVARGFGGDFFTMLGVLNRAGLGSHEDYLDPESDPQLQYETIYELTPGDQFLTIRFRVTNISEADLQFPGSDVTTLLSLLPGLSLDGFTIPVGEVALFGATSPVFAPGAGFGVRYSLREAYESGVDFPAFPGLVTDWVASRGDDVSYGLFIDESDDNYVFNKAETYENETTEVTRSSLLIFLEASGFFGIFEFNGPDTLEVGETWEAVKYLAVGSGDVGSILDVINGVRDVSTGQVGGTVVDGRTGAPCTDCSVLIYQAGNDTRRIFSQYDTREGGRFVGSLESGLYSARVLGDGRELTDFVDFAVVAGRVTNLELNAEPQGRLVVTVLDNHGRRLPARVTAVGTYGEEHIGERTRDFLFDVHAGQGWHFSDMVPDTEDADTRRYIEAMEPTHNGIAELLVRPGTYQVYSSRGPEYDLQSTEVTVAGGQTVSVTGNLTRVVDTTGWIAGDMHIHTINSVDAENELDSVVQWMAAEGVEWAVATDHNYITNFGPAVVANHLEDWMVSSVGLELTTLDGGHFNGYPLEYAVGPVTHGSFEWSLLPPDRIFEMLRGLGAYGPDNTIVQVNHPRDSVLGYFNQFRRDGFTGEFVEPGFIAQFLSESGPMFYDENGDTTFSLDFNVLEVFNGSHTEFLHHYRVPEVLPDGEFPEDIPPAGSILIDEDGEVLFPGGVDDWYNFLNLGERFVAVGTSDTHHDSDPSGYARTMIYVGRDDPRSLTELDLAQGLLRRQAVATNGPLLNLWINDPEEGAMGREIRDTDGSVDVTVSMTAAPWISLSRINIVRNGLIAHTFEIDPDRDLAANPFEETVAVPMETDDESGDIRDSWFVAEAVGYRSLFPVIWPYEVPPIIISDAIGSLAGPLGLDSTVYGDLKPAPAFPVSAYALTNPVWVANDDEFTPPGPIPWRVRTEADNDPALDANPFGYTMTAGSIDPERVRDVAIAPRIADPQIRIFQRDPGNPFDIRRIFETFGHK